MTTRTALFALLAMWGVGSVSCLPAFAEDEAPEEVAGSADASADSTPAKRSFTNRVWVKQASGSNDDDLPGVMRIFLSDGTLVQDSCWETHRLSAWQMTTPGAVTWNEDGIDITADIVSVSADSLVLNVQLVGGETLEEHYTAAEVPYLCPDMPKGV